MSRKVAFLTGGGHFVVAVVAKSPLFFAGRVACHTLRTSAPETRITAIADFPGGVPRAKIVVVHLASDEVKVRDCSN